MILPGPDAIPPGTAPGGIVFHVYAVPSCRLVARSVVTPGDDVEREAGRAVEEAADAAGDEAFCLVAYDGDHGGRVSITAALWGD